ncbi:Odorant receptor 2a [Gryllus bimaculatus]|nr:Odorant receptor 2a [Gryllus bimaculatus]
MTELAQTRSATFRTRGFALQLAHPVDAAMLFGVMVIAASAIYIVSSRHGDAIVSSGSLLHRDDRAFIKMDRMSVFCLPSPALHITYGISTKILATLTHTSFSSVYEVQSVISAPVLVQFVVCMTVMCMALYATAANSGGDNAATTKYGVYLYTIMIQLFLYCWYGDRVTQRHEEVAQSAYGCGWASGSQHFKKGVLLVLLRAQKTLSFRGGVFYDLSRNTFLYVRICKPLANPALRTQRGEKLSMHLTHSSTSLEPPKIKKMDSHF